MKKIVLYSIFLIILGCAATLTAMAPDVISIIFGGTMTGVVMIGGILGILPMIRFSAGFDTAIRNIRRAQNTQTTIPWIVIAKMDNFFNQRVLDGLFMTYREKVEEERKNNMIIGGIDEIINEEELGLRCWLGVITQISGTLTGLGLLGTFVGLIKGIGSIQISSLEATISSIQILLEGIGVAFYTSIAGVILSILFNMYHKILWNIMIRDLGVFTTQFQRNIIPAVDEQIRYSRKKDMEKIQDQLKNLPRNEGFSLANTGSFISANTGNESVLMPQILSGLENEEFFFYLQPRYDLNTQKIIGAEALVRWNHSRLGIIAPSVFVPVLENNGYIVKLDQYIWEKVCEKLKEWIDQGIHPVPITVNISKTDILALDIAEVFPGLIEKYALPPKYIELDIAQNAYLESKDIVLQYEKTIQQKGFRTILDGFKGEFFELHSGNSEPYADAYKLDLRFCKDNLNILSIVKQARSMQVELIVEGIENTKQMSELRKCGIVEGQGFYLSKAVSVEEFEKMMKWRSE